METHTHWHLPVAVYVKLACLSSFTTIVTLCGLQWCRHWWQTPTRRQCTQNPHRLAADAKREDTNYLQRSPAASEHGIPSHASLPENVHVPGADSTPAKTIPAPGFSGNNCIIPDSARLPLYSPVNLDIRINPYDSRPRAQCLSWDDYFMAVAFLSAQRSKDPNKQVGACIVNSDRVILGIGYNGFPRGCCDHNLPWAKKSHDNNPLNTKYPYVVHAEANALLNKNSASVSGASIYVTMFPCNECAKLLIQAGITEVIYHEAKVNLQGEESTKRSRVVFSNRQPVFDLPHEPDQPKTDGDIVHKLQPIKTTQDSAITDACYLASCKMLMMADVKLRHHQLQRTVYLPPLE